MATKLKPAADELVHVEDLANAWEVDQRTVKNWTSYVYQAFEILLPASGPFPQWGAELIALTAKHVSSKANLYYAETGENRRLKASEFVKKIRAMRLAGHFGNYDQFRQLQNFQNFQADEAGLLEDDVTAEFGDLTRQIDQEVNRAKEAVQNYEDGKVEEFAEFIEQRPQRMMNGLLTRLKQSKAPTASMTEAIDVTCHRLPSA